MTDADIALCVLNFYSRSALWVRKRWKVHLLLFLVVRTCLVCKMFGLPDMYIGRYIYINFAKMCKLQNFLVKYVYRALGNVDSV